MSARRWIVLLTVLNVSVLAWWWLRPPAPAEAVVPAASDVPPLQLAKQTGAPRPASVAMPAPTPTPEPVVTPAAESVAEDTPPVAQLCFTLGPYREENALARDRTRLAGQGRTLTVRRETTSAQGFNVFLPPQGSPEAAKATAERLRSAGFDDLFVMAEGSERANGIALGRFSSEERAQARQASLQAAGFAAQIAPVGTSAAERFWLELRAPSGTTAAAVQATAAGATARQRTCPAG